MVFQSDRIYPVLSQFLLFFSVVLAQHLFVNSTPVDFQADTTK